MLFDLREIPIPPETAPFRFDSTDSCHHDLPDDCWFRAGLSEGRSGLWLWSASHRFIRPDVPEEIDYAEDRTDGSAATRADALTACVAWMRGRLK